jgi:translation initiation factor IF-2
MAFTNTVGLSVDIKKSTDKTYEEMNSLVTQLSRKVTAHNFREYIDEFNWNTKRRLWKEVHENKYTIFNNKMSYDVHKEFKEKEESQWSRKAKRLHKKRMRLEQNINDDWIDENVKYIKFKYPFITPQEVRTGEIKPVNNKRLLNGNVLGKAVIKRSGFMFIGVAFNAFISALA